MLYEFLIGNRSEILRRSREKLGSRKVPTPTRSEIVNGLPLFLDQLVSILQLGNVKGDVLAARHASVEESATIHGGDLLRIGLTVGQVVHDYGSICQSVTELADERNVEITAEEFQIFNRCLDDAIAQAVTAYERQRDRNEGGAVAASHLAFLAHEMRNLLSTSMLTFDALSRGGVGIQGSTGMLLGRSLRRMRVLIDRTLAEVRLEAGTEQSERVSVAELIEEIEIVATIEAKERDIRLSVEAGAIDVAVQADRQILTSAVANLIQNAFKFTRAHGHVSLRAHTQGERVLIDVVDECGGLPPGKTEELFRPFEQRATNKEGLGLGLTISRKGVEASGGEIRVVDQPGTGCTFTVDLPRLAN